MTHKKPKSKKISSEIREKLKPRHDLISKIDGNTLIFKTDKESVYITPFSHGFTLEILKEEKSKSKIIFPGEISFKHAVEHISNEISITLPSQKQSKEKAFSNLADLIEYVERDQKLFIAKSLRQSHVWAQRGYASNNNNIPKEYWKKITAENLKKYKFSLEPKKLWQYILEKNDNNTEYYRFNISEKFQNQDMNSELFLIRKEYYKKAIELKIIPEVPWGLRKWTNFSFQDLATHTISGLTRSKHWANYASTCFMFSDTMLDHNVLNMPLREGSPLQKQRDKFLEFLYTWPKTKAGITSLEESFNQGMNMKNILDISPSSPKELFECIQVWRQVSNEKRSTLTDEYHPPELPLKDGYAYIDHTHALKMSSLYSCCFSNDSSYIDRICNGTAFSIFRPKFGGGDKGSLCFFELVRDKETKKMRWEVSQHKGFSNSDPDQKYINDMEVIARALSITHPYAYPVIEQNEEKELENLKSLNPKFIQTYHIARKNNNNDNNQVQRLCELDSLTDAIQVAGYTINTDTYEWEATSVEKMNAYQNNNLRAERILSGLDEYEHEPHIVEEQPLQLQEYAR